MIQVDELEFSYTQSEFQLVIPSLSVGSAESVAIIGPSGTGKSTLLKLVSGILTATKGQVLFNGVDLAALGDSRRRALRSEQIGFIFQNFELLDYLSAFDNILHPYRISRTLQLDAEVRERARQLAYDMGVNERLQAYPSQLSQGEKQRVAICRAVLSCPRLILADEATGNLDPANKQHILDLIFHYIQQSGATLLAVTHDHDLLNRFDHVIDFQAFIHDR
ncbi:MAG: ABC transporter ATP-binding protein [Nitrosomonas sp.]|jgi:putative ABC transport system ATP-binding protein|nr:ABC transporter ATP-binding protein [Nitrosomonas sp.]